MVEDGRVWLARALYNNLPNSVLQYPILYRVIECGNLLIGVDERDLECNE